MTTAGADRPLPITSDREVFVIGDCHGHLDRLEALLKKADVKSRDGISVQLGDLAHNGGSSGNPTDDLLSWEYAYDGNLDIVLYGNHDRAVVDSMHHFGGYARPDMAILHMMKTMEADGRLLMAYEAHGWLITHAGLHAQFKYQRTPPEVDKTSAASIAGWINRRMLSGETEPVIDAIGRRRGGWSQFGGILWRDISEKLYDRVPQVFGHSASRMHVIRGEADKWYCVDVGGKGGVGHYSEADCLAGIWLPSQEVIRIDFIADSP